jgi:hypothetical protein
MIGKIDKAVRNNKMYWGIFWFLNKLKPILILFDISIFLTHKNSWFFSFLRIFGGGRVDRKKQFSSYAIYRIGRDYVKQYLLCFLLRQFCWARLGRKFIVV